MFSLKYYLATNKTKCEHLTIYSIFFYYAACPAEIGHNGAMQGVGTFGTGYQFPVVLMVDQAFPCDTNVVSWRLRIGQQNQGGDGYLTVWRPMEG